MLVYDLINGQQYKQCHNDLVLQNMSSKPICTETTLYEVA